MICHIKQFGIKMLMYLTSRLTSTLVFHRTLDSLARPLFRLLSIAANPITALNNNTFGGILDKLDHVDISSLYLNLLEVFNHHLLSISH